MRPLGSFVLGSPYQDGLVDHATHLIQNDPAAAIDIKIWRKLFRVLSTNSRSVLRVRLLNEAKDAGGMIQQQFFQYFGEELLHKDVMIPDNAMVIELFIPMVQNRNIAGMRWISKAITEHPRLLSDPQTSAAIDDLRNRIAEMIAEDSSLEAGPDPAMVELLEKL